MTYYSKTVDEVLSSFGTIKQNGLTFAQVEKVRKEKGKNILPRAGVLTTRWKVFFDQWKSPLILILVVAAIISFALSELTDAIVISITILVNILVGYLQENKANQALKKLRQMIQYKAIVIRDSKKVQIPSEDIVPGDVLYLEAGDKIQADGRIIEARDLEVNESVLTGESEPIKKSSQLIEFEVPVADRKNMLYRGTIVGNGNAVVVVTAIGGETEIGKIAHLVKNTEEDRTPLQKQLLKLSKALTIIVLIISVIIFLVGLLSNYGGYTLFELFETTVALAVSAIPESLVVTLTVILAVSMQRILRRNALVRKLVSAETLGSVSVICVDKTGTITEGKMKATRLVTFENDLDKSELDILSVLKEEKNPDALFALRIGVLCNNAVFNKNNTGTGDNFVGDTTETALAEVALQAGINKQNLDAVFIRSAELPFDSNKKFMATLHNFDGKSRLYIKGAPEVLISQAGYYEKNGKKIKLNPKNKKWFEDKEDEMAKKGLRLLALGYKDIKAKQELEEKDIDDFVLVGLVALSDPLRTDVKSTLDIARQAGIRVVMITGDHAKTAQAIGKEIGLDANKDNIFDGKKLDSISDKELVYAVGHVSIFARVDPKHKIRIVRALKESGEVVAMTGDGVNDGPALKGADVGVALGSGTDVAKEISDLVLLDDKFSTIVSAVEEGRTVYQNMRRVVLYLLTGSTTEVFLITACLIGGLPLAIIPVQILWINIMEDSFPALALSFEKGEKENMGEKPRPKNELILSRQMKSMLVIVAIMSNITLLGLYLYLLRYINDLELVRTIIFVTLGVSSVLVVYTMKSLRKMIWRVNPFSNVYVTLSVFVATIMLLASVYWHPLRLLLHTVPLSGRYWVMILIFSFSNIAFIELMKFIFLIRIKNRQLAK